MDRFRSNKYVPQFALKIFDILKKRKEKPSKSKQKNISNQNNSTKVEEVEEFCDNNKKGIKITEIDILSKISTLNFVAFIFMFLFIIFSYVYIVWNV